MLYHLRKLRPLISTGPEYAIRRTVYSFLPSRSPSVDTLMHCCVWKTASQWVRLVLSDPRIYQASGLTPYHGRQIMDGHSAQSPATIKSGTVCTSLYVSHDTFLELDKPKQWRAFFVVRDPRDLIVSRYHSDRFSHRDIGRMSEVRNEMSSMSDEDGLLYIIEERFQQLADIISSWINATRLDNNRDYIRIVRFEELTSENNVQVWFNLLSELGVTLPIETLRRVLNFYHHSRLRPPKSNVSSKAEKYRSGKHGEWHSHFSPAVAKRFDDRFGHLVTELGYSDA